MVNNIALFQENFPSAESYWRSIILFGKNIASYKFALAKSILEIVSDDKTEVNVKELAIPFSRHLCEHLKHSPKQCTSPKNTFFEACAKHNDGLISDDVLIDITVKHGFKYVLDAFHIVNDEQLPVNFFVKDFDKRSKKIIMTDEIFKLKESSQFKNFMCEAESRWNLVEASWGMGLSRNLLTVQYDDKSNLLFVDEDKQRRKDVTSSKHALNGYQKGKCFYCFDDISVDSKDDNSCEVDHFYPHVLQAAIPQVNLNGVWNLVLSCNKCNRGANGKFAKVPDGKYIERLYKRNEFLISSHHPLRETLIRQTGATERERINFLREIDNLAINLLIHRWSTDPKGNGVF